MAFAKRTPRDSYPFFKTRDYLNSFALLFEPRSQREARTKWGDQTFVDAHITVFETSDQLKKGEPAIAQTFTIGGGALAGDMSEYIGEQRLVNIIAVPTDKGNDALVARDVEDPAVEEAALAYLDARDRASEDALNDLLGG